MVMCPFFYQMEGPSADKPCPRSINVFLFGEGAVIAIDPVQDETGNHLPGCWLV